MTITANANTGTGRTAVFRVVPNGVKTQEIEIIQGNSYIPTTDGEIPGSSCHRQRSGPDKGKRPAKWRNVLGNAGNAY